MACTAPSNWAQLISRTRLRGPLRSWPSSPRGSSLWGERARSGESGRRRVDLEGMDGAEPSPAARRRSAPQLGAELPRGFRLTFGVEEVLQPGPVRGQERPVDPLLGRQGRGTARGLSLIQI